jgi:hypothetical protein
LQIIAVCDYDDDDDDGVVVGGGGGVIRGEGRVKKSLFVPLCYT